VLAFVTQGLVLPRNGRHADLTLSSLATFGLLPQVVKLHPISIIKKPHLHPKRRKPKKAACSGYPHFCSLNKFWREKGFNKHIEKHSNQ
jgi:hypothetical protein